MIQSIFIQNFIIFEQINLDFHQGFSAFTGETGAGKSLLIDAISFLLAEKASPSIIRQQCDKAFVEAVFNLGKDAKEKLEEAGFDNSEDTIISRELRSDGKNTYKINYRTCTASLIKTIMENEIDIHSQHDNQYLLKQSNHRQLLNHYINHDELIKKVSTSYQEWKTIEKEKEYLLKEEFNNDELERMISGKEEIERANVQLGEDDELVRREKEINTIIKHIERLRQSYQTFDTTIQPSMYDVLKNLGQCQLEEKLQRQLDLIHTSYIETVDFFESIHDLIEQCDYSEKEINDIQERLFLLSRLKHKYGLSIEAILKKKEELTINIERFYHREEVLEEIEKRIKIAYDNFMENATALRKERQEKSVILDEAISQQLKDLKLPYATFKTELLDDKESKDGIDQVTFLISMNPGEQLKPLAKVASGGELSRVMLGLKGIFSSLQGIETIIFDEIDTGISGPVALSIGKKMSDLATSCQVFSVTHLAQVASCSDFHYHVIKNQTETMTTTEIHQCNENERIEALAMISQGQCTPTSLKAAKELLEHSQKLCRK